MTNIITKFSIFLCFALVFSMLNTSNASDEYLNKSTKKNIDNTMSFFCKDESTLIFINLNENQCISYITDLAFECNAAFKTLAIELGSVQKKKRDNINKLLILYGNCIKSKIYETRKENFVSMKIIRNKRPKKLLSED